MLQKALEKFPKPTVRREPMVSNESEKLKEQGIKSLQENAMETWENIVAEVRLYKIASLFGHIDMLIGKKGSWW